MTQSQKQTAQKIGGGGHAVTAGFRLKMDFSKAEKYVLFEIKKYLRQNPNLS